jgi:CRP-like cAMP-binding protein
VTGRDNALVERLRSFTTLTPAQEARLRAVAEASAVKPTRRDLIREGERSRAAFLILAGWACRHRTLEDGRRQILQFLLPGDLCDVHNALLGRMDHSIGALTEVRYAEIAHERIAELEADPDLRRALQWQSVLAAAAQREWTVNIGLRNAMERLAHLFCELFVRLRAMDMTDGHACDFPLTQVDLAEATGLTPVHVNRTLQEMRRTGLIVLDRRRLTIPDLTTLQEVGLFSATYLHLGREQPEPAPKRAMW